MNKGLFALALVAALGMSCSRGVQVKEVLLATRPAHTGNEGLTFPCGSPDARRVVFWPAVVGQPDWRHMVSIVVDNVKGKAYHEIDRMVVFSPDSKHYFYKARLHQKWTIVTDGVEGPWFDKVQMPVFGAQGGHWAYSGRRGNAKYVVLDGVERAAPHADDWTLCLSPDGEHYAYATEGGFRGALIVDGKIRWSADWDLNISRIKFSPDGKRVACVVPGFRGVVSPHEKMSPGHRTDLLCGVAVDGKIGPMYDNVCHTWSKRSDVKQKRKFVLLDYPARDDLAFSPDSRRLAYDVTRGGKDVMLVDGKEASPVYDEAGLPVYSPDGRHFAYAAVRNGKMFVVVDGREGPAYDGIIQIQFGGNGASVVYLARSGDRMVVVHSGREIDRGRNIHDLVIGPNSTHVAYWKTDFDINSKTDEPPISSLCVDGRPVGAFDSLLDGTGPRFGDSSHVTAMANRGESTFRIEVTLPD